MTLEKKAFIRGLGSYLPKKVLTNADLEKLVDTSDDWIVSRTGMKERRICAENEFTSDMGTLAAKRALENAKLPAENLDLILVATLSPDYIFPSTACIIQDNLQAKNAGAVDIQAACSGFLYALSMAKAYIESGMYKNILVIASEKLSSIIDYQDRNTCVLFGDGAAAAVVSSEKGFLSLGSICLGADGSHQNLLCMPAGGCRKPASTDTINNREHYLKMDGKEVFRHAVKKMQAATLSVLKQHNIQESEITYLIPHQANVRIIEAIAKRCKIPKEKVIKTIDKYGNTSASSLGISLDELTAKNRIQEGEHLLLVAFGAGLTWSACVLTGESKS